MSPKVIYIECYNKWLRK